MSNPYDDDFRYQDGPPRPQRTPAWAFGFVLLAGGITLLIVGLSMLPDLRRQWLESDPNFMLRMRAVEARAEAEAAFRKREAELKAEAEAAGSRLAKQDIPPSPLRDVVARAAPTVVSISSAARFRPDDREERVMPPGHPRLDEFVRSEGSGVIARVDANKKGYIITNNHVVREADRLTITLQSGRTLHVERSHIYMDPVTDLAVLQFDASSFDHLATAEFANSDAVMPGDWVVAIGNPFGLQQSVTFGIVSAKGRANLSIVDDGELIQTDVAINPGNSGGPLLDLKGRVVGINTAIFTRNGGNQGVGFAIPATTAQLVFEKLIQPPHKISRGYMGVGMAELNDREALKLGIPGGVRVNRVLPGLPAAEAGLQVEDVIVRFDRTPVSRMNQLRKMVMDKPPSSTVPLDIVRMEDGKPTQHSLRITLTEKPLPDAFNPRP